MTAPSRRLSRTSAGSPAAEGWRALPFFADGTADDVAARVDERIAAGAQVLPAA